MDLGSHLIDAAVVIVTGLFVTYMIRDRANHQERFFRSLLDAHQKETVGHIAVLQAQFTAHEAKNESQFAAIQAQVSALGASMDRQFASVRSDLTQVALAVGAQPRPQAG